MASKKVAPRQSMVRQMVYIDRQFVENPEVLLVIPEDYMPEKYISYELRINNMDRTVDYKMPLYMLVINGFIMRLSHKANSESLNKSGIIKSVEVIIPKQLNERYINDINAAREFPNLSHNDIKRVSYIKYRMSTLNKSNDTLNGYVQKNTEALNKLNSELEELKTRNQTSQS